MKNVNELLESLEVALRLESEGQSFFQEAARTVTGKAARRTFEFLAAEEEKHIKRIGEFYQSLEQTNGAIIPDTVQSDADRRMAEFESRLAELRHEIKPTLSDIEAYRTALKFENGAEDFYSQQIKMSVDPKIQRFYQWLIDEESMHAKVLQSCVQFAENPAAWFRARRQ